MSNWKIRAFLAFCFSLAMSLSAAVSQLTFRDSWKGSGGYIAARGAYGVTTTGSFSISVSVPLNGIDLSEANENSFVELVIGPPGVFTFPIIYSTLSDAIYTPGQNSAAFPIFGTDDLGKSVLKGSLKFTWTRTTLTLSGSVPSDFLGEEQLFAAQSSGTATNRSIDGFYEVDMMMEAIDNGGGYFSYENPRVAVKGSNKETEYAVPTGGFLPEESGSITGTGDAEPPRLSVTSPPPGFKVYDANAVIELKGTASDRDGVTSVECAVNGAIGSQVVIDQFRALPTHSLAWTAKVDLSLWGHVGTNILTVISQDSSGNQASVSRTCYWIETNVASVSVSPLGAGKITGIKDGQLLEVDHEYPLTPIASGTNWIFSEWIDGSGDVLSTNAAFDFVDENGTLTNSSPPTVIAVFVPNPFSNPVLAGAYTGLYYDMFNGPQVSDTGYITVSVTKTGAFSGKLYNAAHGKSVFPFSGKLSESLDGSHATADLPLIKVSTSNYLQISLQITTDPSLADSGAGVMSGFVNSLSGAAGVVSGGLTNDIAEIQGELSHYNTNTVAGLYNVVIAPVSYDPSLGPGGYSFASATVSDKKGSAGDVIMTLHLADSSVAPITFGSALAQDGACPFYAALYGGKGAIFGWMQFETNGSSSLDETTAYWMTDTNYTSSVYAAGFQGQPLISGGLYLPAKAGTNILGTLAPVFEIDPGYSGLSSPDEADISVEFNPSKSIFTISNKVDKLSINFIPSTGAFSGTFVDPDNGKSSAYKGVIVNGSGTGYWAASSKETGPILLLDPAALLSESGGGGLIMTGLVPIISAAPALNLSAGGFNLETNVQAYPHSPIVPPPGGE